MKRTSVVPFVIGGILLALVCVVGGYAVATFKSPAVIKDSGSNLSDISAVFVNGGGIYFGKITQLTPDVLALDSVYTYGVVPTDSTSTSTSTTQPTKPTLFDASKVGIAPASHYNINRSQVILWYSLSNDSDVVKTIQKYQSSKQ